MPLYTEILFAWLASHHVKERFPEVLYFDAWSWSISDCYVVGHEEKWTFFVLYEHFLANWKLYNNLCNHLLLQGIRDRNPVPYEAEYFGHKMHMDQNEKLVMFGVTHVIAVDGYSCKVVAKSTIWQWRTTLGFTMRCSGCQQSCRLQANVDELCRQKQHTTTTFYWITNTS
jgi:hypothetical protein